MITKLVVIALAVMLIVTIISHRKEKKDMAVIYCTLIVKGKKTLNDVPQLIRADVEELLKALEVEV